MEREASCNLPSLRRHSVETTMFASFVVSLFGDTKLNYAHRVGTFIGPGELKIRRLCNVVFAVWPDRKGSQAACIGIFCCFMVGADVSAGSITKRKKGLD